MRRRTLYDMSDANLEKTLNAIEVSSWNISGNAAVCEDGAVNGKYRLRFNKEDSPRQGNFVFKTGGIYDYSFLSRGIGSVGLHYILDSNNVDVETFRVECEDWIKSYLGNSK